MQRKRGRKSSAELAIVRPSPEPIPRRPPAHPAPNHLQPETKAWWDIVVAEYQLEPHHLRLLQLAGESWDRCQQARATLVELGLTFADQHDCPKTRPEVAIERDSRLAFARLVRELDLDVEMPAMSGWDRPPALRSNRG